MTGGYPFSTSYNCTRAKFPATLNVARETSLLKVKLHLILINADLLQLTPNKGREVKSGRNCIHAFEAQRLA